MRLCDIADIKTGLVLSRKAADLAEESYFSYPQLNLKCIRENGTINKQELEIFHSVEELSNGYLTKPGDIIVRLTVPNTSVFIAEETKGIVVPSHFCIVRPQPDKAIAGYIQWYLNSDIVKSKIAKSITGAAFAAIKPSFLHELEIKPHSLEEQLRIANIYQMLRKEIGLLETLKCNKELYYNSALIHIYNRNSK